MDKFLRNVTIFAGIILVVAAIAMTIVLSGKNSDNSSGLNSRSGDTTTVALGDVQDVKLSVSAGQYILTPSTLHKGVPVRMTADINTLKGCARSVVISDFGVRKYVDATDNIIEFTPTKTGEIGIACSMNMYRGTFTVI